MSTQTLTTLALLGCLGLMGAEVSAATICGDVFFWDERDNIDANSKLTTNLVDKRAHEVKIYIYDQDGACIDSNNGCNESNDDLLATVYTNTTGDFCATISEGQDIYFQHRLENIHGVVFQPDGSYYRHNSLLLFTDFTGTQTVPWNLTCWDDPDGNGLCSTQPNVNTNYPVSSDRVVMLESMYDAAQFLENTGTLNINGVDYPEAREFVGYYPTKNGNSVCDLQTNMVNINDQEICASSSNVTQNHRIAHEIGHALHRRALHLTTESLVGSASCGSSNWGSTDGTEKCAVVEGFANFVSGAVYWDKSVSTAWYSSSARNFEGDTTHTNNNNSLSCVTKNSNPHKAEGNVARWFWDLYDSTTVGTGENGLTDDATMNFYSIVDGWDDFTIGTDNRQHQESGNVGRNAYDYQNYISSSLSELDHNCLDSQTP